MSLPTAKEINPIPENLDGAVAERHFLGKTLEEAEALFRENSLCYQEDLMWMGPVAFRYYVQAAIGYIQSEASAEDSDMINCFTSILEFRLNSEQEELRVVASELASVCDYILKHFDRFDLAEAIYGRVREHLAAVHNRFLKLKNSKLS